MKVLVIPDVHLKPDIFERADKIMQKGTADIAVCLMDIPDDWNKQFDIELYEETFDKAIAFEKKYPSTLWAWGNHDYSYVWTLQESGYSWLAQEIVFKKLKELIRALPQKESLAYVHRIDNVLFAHGGLCEDFVNKHVPKRKRGNVDAVLKVINGLGPESMWNDLSPIWLRPQGSEDIKLYKEDVLLQVVGHTPVKKPCIERNFLSCDVFSTKRDGSPYGCQRFVIVDTKSETFKIAEG